MANQVLNAVHIAQAATVLLSHEIRTRHIRTDLSREIIGHGVNHSISWDLPDIVSSDLLYTIDRFSDKFIAPSICEIGNVLAMRSGLQVIRMQYMELPIGCEWSEGCTDGSTGVKLRLCRYYDVRHDYMQTNISLQYLVSQEGPQRL